MRNRTVQMHTVNINILMKEVHMISKYNTMYNVLIKNNLTHKHWSFKTFFLVFAKLKKKLTNIRKMGYCGYMQHKHSFRDHIK